uniref:Neural proliferation, differentiation and control, 1b n=1 Tax=Cyprinodon variegatus TaxID=28743 RepID=A0A3Q2CJE5_CYPVA
VPVSPTCAVSPSSGSHRCPGSLDCARAGRQFCRPGGSRCGACLHPLVENSDGRCVSRRSRAHHSAPHSAPHSSEPPSDHLFLCVLSHEQRVHRSGFTGFGHSRSLLGQVRHLSSVFSTRSRRMHVDFQHASLLIDVFCFRLQKGVRLTQKVDYPAYGVMKAQTFGNFPGDKKLAQSAQMYHYQHQKQQMLSLEKSRDEPRIPDSGASTDEENEDGDFTVYECPGLAPTGEMEVKNPLFDDSNLYLQRFHK